MVDATLIPIMAGLAVGITFVVLFSVMLKPAFTLPDRELVLKYSELPEVKFFLERYPDAKGEVFRDLGQKDFEIEYSVEKQVEPPTEQYTGVNTLAVHVYTRPDHYHPRPVDMSCQVHQGLTIGWTFADFGGMDEAERICFHGDYPSVSHDLSRQSMK